MEQGVEREPSELRCNGFQFHKAVVVNIGDGFQSGNRNPTMNEGEPLGKLANLGKWEQESNDGWVVKGVGFELGGTDERGVNGEKGSKLDLVLGE
ncbi:hypothetical protein JHK86_036667 [Glycine max]|nr:hypothetical protein JHK86_036667 [Glycine max]